jgi:inosine-uridine nucleoside N-ribohydrolase
MHHGEAERRRVLVTTDCGADMDDQWALAHLAVSAEVDLCGVVTTHAPNLADPAAITAAQHAKEVLDHVAVDNLPTIELGSSVPLRDRAPLPSPGVDFILDEAEGCSPSDRLTVLVLGAATDVASALLTDPTLGDRIEIIAMAFDGWPGGDDGFNVRNDITAWQVLLEAKVPITVGDAAVTRSELAMTLTQAEGYLADCGTAGSFLIQLLADWLELHKDMANAVTGDPTAWPVWDEVAAAHLLSLTTTVVHPRPRLRNDVSFDHKDLAGAEADSDSIQWITGIDGGALWLHLRQSLRASSLA